MTLREGRVFIAGEFCGVGWCGGLLCFVIWDFYQGTENSIRGYCVLNI